MKKLLIIFFLFIPILGYAQDVDIQKVRQMPKIKDSLLNMHIDNYALLKKKIEKEKLYDNADIYWVCSIPMQKDTIDIYLFTMPSNASSLDWEIAIKRDNNLSFYSYNIYLYQLIYDLSNIATEKDSMTSSTIMHAIYTILSYCSDFYNETKREIVGNDIYEYSFSSWVQIFKKNSVDFHNRNCIKKGRKYVPIRKMELQIVDNKCSLSKISIDNWLKKTYGISDIGYKLYQLAYVDSYKSIYLLETKHSKKRHFDFVFQTNDKLSFYLPNGLFIPLAFKLKDFIGDKNQDELFKSLKYLCLSYMYQYGSCPPFKYKLNISS